MKINKPWNPKGDFLTNYDGQNRAILNSFNRITFQNIILNKSVTLDGGITERCCFEITLLGRKFLMVLNDESIYEIFEQEGERVFIRLTASWMYVIDHKQEEKSYIVHGLINLHYQYAPLAEFVEPFTYQLNLFNSDTVREMFEGINNNN